ncbi:uncharacterized protein MONBRDRAFT_31583 [Monosiga brevicollis MX1]|uniref:Elongation factor Ts, mitochondrial n=1 Tax=Monosiga brevicollis TaxID=81824 RepID=A9UU60_MONBE|nr:uncharacterized protein MONBRDRAFT_31583 [Monosiga brevicollis MX1]EDQ91365.1 predicted protein [Monosiga brevicollis MX1]|eukprot:XP_001743787.1 hypothetical protein [Monosiga brevicollis MX1]
MADDSPAQDCPSSPHAHPAVCRVFCTMDTHMDTSEDGDPPITPPPDLKDIAPWRTASDDEADETLGSLFPNFKYGERLRVSALLDEREPELGDIARPGGRPASPHLVVQQRDDEGEEFDRSIMTRALEDNSDSATVTAQKAAALPKVARHISLRLPPAVMTSTLETHTSLLLLISCPFCTLPDRSLPLSQPPSVSLKLSLSNPLPQTLSFKLSLSNSLSLSQTLSLSLKLSPSNSLPQTLPLKLSPSNSLLLALLHMFLTLGTSLLRFSQPRCLLAHERAEQLASREAAEALLESEDSVQQTSNYQNEPPSHRGGLPLACLVNWEDNIIWEHPNGQQASGVNANVHEVYTEIMSSNRDINLADAEDRQKRDEEQQERNRREKEARSRNPKGPTNEGDTKAEKRRRNKSPKVKTVKKQEQERLQLKYGVATDAKHVVPIMAVNSMPKPVVDVSTAVSELPPINEHLCYERWENKIYWTKDDIESSSSEEEPDEEDGQDEDHLAKHKKRHSNLYLDLNDPLFVSDYAVRAPTFKRYMILHQGRGRQYVADWKLERIAKVMAERGPFAEAANQAMGLQRFNVSNDFFYQPRVGTQTEQRHAWRSMLQYHVRHPRPARRVYQKFFPWKQPFMSFRHWHRPLLKPEKKPCVLANGSQVTAQFAPALEEFRRGSKRAFHKTWEISAFYDQLVVLEYAEEYPPLLCRPSMCSELRCYYRKIKANDRTRPSIELGTLAILNTNEESPFLGTLPPGHPVMSIENNLFRAPIYDQKLEQTDFLLVKRNDQWFILRLKTAFVVGQTLPKLEVPAPNSKREQDLEKRHLEMIIINLFNNKMTDPRRSPNDPVLLRVDDVRRTTNSTDSSIRKVLKEYATFKRHAASDFKGAWEWRSVDKKNKIGQELLEGKFSPEDFCAYESMKAAEQRLVDMGYRLANDKNLEAIDETDPGTSKGRRFWSVLLLTLGRTMWVQVDERRLAPWQITKNFVDCIKRSCLLAVTGAGDPTGHSLGYSFLRLANKPAANRRDDEMLPELPESRNKQLGKMSSKDKDLRKLNLKEARELLHQKYGLGMDYLNSLPRWQCISLVRYKANEEADEQGKTLNYSRGTKSSAAEHKMRFTSDSQLVFDNERKSLENDEILSEPETSDGEDGGADGDDDLSDLDGEDAGEDRAEAKAARELRAMISQDRERAQTASQEDAATVNEVASGAAAPERRPQAFHLKIVRKVGNRTHTALIQDPKVIQAYLHQRRHPHTPSLRRQQTKGSGGNGRRTESDDDNDEDDDDYQDDDDGRSVVSTASRRSKKSTKGPTQRKATSRSKKRGADGASSVASKRSNLQAESPPAPRELNVNSVINVALQKLANYDQSKTFQTDATAPSGMAIMGLRRLTERARRSEFETAGEFVQALRQLVDLKGDSNPAIRALGNRMITVAEEEFKKHNVVTVAHVKKLREQTALPMKLCREALEASNDNVDAALQWLQDNEEARGQQALGKLAGRSTAQGRLAIAINEQAAAVLQLNCETDFVARNEAFGETSRLGAESLAQWLAQNKAEGNDAHLLSAEEVAAVPVAESDTLADRVKALVAAVGENVALARGAGFVKSGATFGSYVHDNGSYAALVLAETSGADRHVSEQHNPLLDTRAMLVHFLSSRATSEALNKVAQHAAAIDPTGDSAAATVENLLSAPYVFNSSQTVAEFIKSAAKDQTVTVQNVLRWERS